MFKATMYGHFMSVVLFNSFWFGKRRDNEETKVALDHIREPFVCERRDINNILKDHIVNFGYYLLYIYVHVIVFVHFVMYLLVSSIYFPFTD